MKKLLGFIAIAMAVVLLPMSVSAAELKTSCEKSCPTEDGKCTANCLIKVEGNKDKMNTFTGNLNIVGDGVVVKDFVAGEGWTKVAPSETDLANSTIAINFMSAAGVSEENFTLATFKLELESAAVDCSLKLTSPSFAAVETKVTTTTETKTGASLPIAIALVGVAGAVVIYATSKKSKKIYKI